MGYDLHITRREFWADNRNDITAEEWLAIIDADPELTVSGRGGPFFAVWCGPCRYGESWFDWTDGQIHTKNPDKRIAEKVLQIAHRLNARVQGDDGEFYEDTSGVPD